MKRKSRYKDIQLGQLRSFCLVATQENFTTAARMTGLSLSTVWEQIRSLEQNLGVTLLLRKGRNVALTPEGQLLLDVARPSVEQLDSLHELFSGRSFQPPRRLTVATSPYTLQHILPRTMKLFAAKYPKVHISVQFAESFDVAARVERGQVDLALHAFDPEARLSPALEYEEVVALPLQLLVPQKHPLARKRSVSLIDVVPNPVILVGLKSFAGQILHRSLRRQGLENRLNVVMEAGSPDAIQDYLVQGLGIALIHMSLQDSLVKGLRRVHFDPPLESLPYAFMTRRNAPPCSLVEDFRGIARKSMPAQNRLP